ncbi:hypothetical protein FRC11_007194 [Ceratobasidium sp. 423]|nr:hypothetical protein FRC11_007194 [Ceratobasidium sp. 423]
MAPPSGYEDLHEFKFLDADMVSIRSLILDIFAFNDFRRTHFSALEYFLAKCATGSLTHYIARTDGFTPPLFIETAETPQDPRVNLLRFPKSRLEERWSSVKVLSVSGLCPHWSSALYHGLVDLRLGSNIPKITESQIISILKASPGLHTLHLKNQITLETTEGTTVTRVQLNELEVLNIEDGEWHTLGNSEIVRWIQPGVKPLRFTLFGVPTPTVADFFKRSNITRFYSQRWDSFTLVDVLRMGPQLQTLVLNASDRDVETIETLVGPINEKGSLATSTPIRIHTLYLLGFKRLKLSDIQEAVNRYSVQRLFLWTCCLAYQSHTGEGTCEDETIIQQKLSEIQNCPVVEHLTCYLNPVDPGDWE